MALALKGCYAGIRAGISEDARRIWAWLVDRRALQIIGNLLNAA
jgi:hypothetical protein